MRYTQKNKDYHNDIHYEIYYEKTDNGIENSITKHITNCNVINKIGQLEDIEDELGIGLIALFKALKSGFYDSRGNYHHFSNLYIGIDSIYDGFTREEFEFKDYGKTWH